MKLPTMESKEHWTAIEDARRRHPTGRAHRGGPMNDPSNRTVVGPSMNGYKYVQLDTEEYDSNTRGALYACTRSLAHNRLLGEVGLKHCYLKWKTNDGVRRDVGYGPNGLTYNKESDSTTDCHYLEHVNGDTWDTIKSSFETYATSADYSVTKKYHCCGAVVSALTDLGYTKIPDRILNANHGWINK